METEPVVSLPIVLPALERKIQATDILITPSNIFNYVFWGWVSSGTST